MKTPALNVLLIEDSLDDADLVQEVLEQIDTVRLTIVWERNLADGLKRLTDGGIDVVLLDLSLPDSFSIQTLRKTLSQAPEIPVVVLTGLNDKDVAFEAVQNGAQDYLVKGTVDAEILLRSMLHAVERKRTGTPSPDDSHAPHD